MTAGLGARLSALSIAGAILAAAAGVAAAQRVDTAKLHRKLDSLAAAHHGVVGYAVRDVDAGWRLSLRGDSTFPTASLIKVGVLVTLYDLVEHGQISLNDPLVLLELDKAGGSGVLQYLHSGLTITVRDAAQLMIETSDNTATNLLLQKITLARVNARLDSLHLANTRVHHLVMNRAITTIARDSSEKYGLGKTTPNEMAQLFVLLAQGKAVGAKADSAMLAMLETNDETELLTRMLVGVRAAHKSGKDDDIRTECGLYYLRTRVVVCVLTRANVDQRWIIDNEPERLMGRMGAEIARAVGVPPKAAVEQD